MINYIFLLFILCISFNVTAKEQTTAEIDEEAVSEGPKYADPDNHDTEHSIVDDSPSADENKRVELTDFNDQATPYIMSRFIGTFIGFGLGHLMQGRWLKTGWIYTIGDLATLPVLSDPWPLYGNDEHYSKGVAAYLLIKAAEIYDVWSYDESTKVAVKPVSFFHKNDRHYGFALSTIF